MIKGFKVTISGSYRTANKEIVDFQDVTGYVPYNDIDVVEMHVAARFAPMWLSADEKYPNRINSIRQVFVDEAEEVEHDFGFEGKNIKDLSFEEVQEVVVLKDLRSVPLYKAGSLRDARASLYQEYAKHVMKMDIDKGAFNIMNAPTLIVEGGAKRDLTKKKTNEEILAEETGTPIESKETMMSFDELKKLADDSGVSYHPNIGYDKLYAKLFA